MAAILPGGMRAVSTEISPETGAGGFILPNDRVDVILSKHEKNPDHAATAEVVGSEVILSNIRVLAIDQVPKEKDGQNTVVGRTVTLELKPDQTETLARARQSGTLSLALRSIADLNTVETKSDDRTLKRGESVNIVRFGVSSPSKPRRSPARARPARCRWRCAALPTSTSSRATRTTKAASAATASTWFATAYQPRRRHRSD